MFNLIEDSYRRSVQAALKETQSEIAWQKQHLGEVNVDPLLLSVERDLVVRFNALSEWAQ